MEAIRCPISETHHFLDPDPKTRHLVCPMCKFSVRALDVIRANSAENGLRDLLKRESNAYRNGNTPN